VFEGDRSLVAGDDGDSGRIPATVTRVLSQHSVTHLPAVSSLTLLRQQLHVDRFLVSLGGQPVVQVDVSLGVGRLVGRGEVFLNETNKNNMSSG